MNRRRLRQVIVRRMGGVRTIAAITLPAAILGILSPCVMADEQKQTPKRRYETCRVQIEEYVRSHFHQTVSRIDFDFVFDNRAVGSGDGPKSAAIAYVVECPGYHVFEVFATDFRCDAHAHVGNVPNYIMYRTSEDGC